MGRVRELLFGLILAAIGVGFAAGMLEVGVRMLHLVADRFWEPDAELGTRLIPGKHGWWTQEEREFVVPVQINHQGLRDVEHSYDKPAGTFRILLLGDSFVEAMHVPLADTIGRQLEQRLNAEVPGRRFEVIAAGVSSYGTAGELLYFRKEGKRYHPDLVLLSFYPGNDVKNNSPTLEDYLKPAYGADGDIERIVEPKKSATAHGWRGLLARSKAYQFVRQLLLVRQPRLGQWLIRVGLMRADAVREAPQRGGIPVDYGVYAPGTDPAWQDAWQRTLHLFDELRHETEAAGARFALMIVSSRDQVYPQSWQQIVATNPAMRDVKWDVDAPQRRVEEWCTAQAVACIALSPEFRRAATNGAEPLHYMHDGHWTAAGHRLAAGFVTDFLRQRVIQTTP